MQERDTTVYKSKHVHPRLHTYIHTKNKYIRTQTHQVEKAQNKRKKSESGMSTMLSHIHTYVHVYIHTCILGRESPEQAQEQQIKHVHDAFAHTYIHTYMYTYTHVY